MSVKSRKVDVLITFIINLIFFVAYTCFFELLQEANDDASMSFILEGAYGEYSPYAIFSHVWWGKLVVFMNQLIPQVKWYFVLMYGFMFMAYNALTYSLLRVQGRKIGTISSAVLLLFCGYQTYVHFQFTRVAAIAGVAGVILLFYAIEHATDKFERRVTLVVGAILAIWSSMIRFQMFAMVVALVGGAIGLQRVWSLLQEKKDGWQKKLGTYVVVFGTVGVLSLGLYAVDRSYYSDGEWAEYIEFNEVRAQLVDYGFPDYFENYDLYQSLGINDNDIEFYGTGNKDSELFTLEVMQALLDAKGSPEFSIRAFLGMYPKAFLSISVFNLFLIIAAIAIAVDKKNLYYVIYEFGMIMLFQAYFYALGRYGILRVDYSMWIAAVVALLYGMADSLEEYKAVAYKWVAAVVAIAFIICNAYISNTPIGYAGVVGYSKSIYEQITPDKSHLYITFCRTPEVYFAFNFWEPCEKGELSNIYASHAWEYNSPVKEDILENYGIENIYRDSINNEKVLFIPGTQTAVIQTYIQQNYDENAYFEQVMDVFGVPIYSLKTADGGSQSE